MCGGGAQRTGEPARIDPTWCKAVVPHNQLAPSPSPVYAWCSFQALESVCIDGSRARIPWTTEDVWSLGHFHSRITLALRFTRAVIVAIKIIIVFLGVTFALNWRRRLSLRLSLAYLSHGELSKVIYLQFRIFAFRGKRFAGFKQNLLYIRDLWPQPLSGKDKSMKWLPYASWFAVRVCAIACLFPFSNFAEKLSVFETQTVSVALYHSVH